MPILFLTLWLPFYPTRGKKAWIAWLGRPWRKLIPLEPMSTTFCFTFTFKAIGECHLDRTEMPQLWLMCGRLPLQSIDYSLPRLPYRLLLSTLTPSVPLRCSESYARAQLPKGFESDSEMLMLLGLRSDDQSCSRGYCKHCSFFTGPSYWNWANKCKPLGSRQIFIGFLFLTYLQNSSSRERNRILFEVYYSLEDQCHRDLKLCAGPHYPLMKFFF